MEMMSILILFTWSDIEPQNASNEISPIARLVARKLHWETLTPRLLT